MLTVAASIPDAAARDQFADRIAHKARITEEVVRAEIRGRPPGARPRFRCRGTASGGHIRDAERALLWWIINSPAEAENALKDPIRADLDGLAAGEILAVARSLRQNHPSIYPRAASASSA